MYKVMLHKAKGILWSINRDFNLTDPYEVSKEITDKDIVALQLLGPSNSEIYYPKARYVKKKTIIQQKLWKKYAVINVPEEESIEEWIHNHEKKNWIISNAKTLTPFYRNCILMNEKGGQFELINGKLRPRKIA